MYAQTIRKICVDTSIGIKTVNKNGQKWSMYTCIYTRAHVQFREYIYMRVVYTPGIPYLYMSFSAKEPYN